MSNAIKHRAFGEGRQTEIEGYIAEFLEWIASAKLPTGPVLDIGANYGWSLSYAQDAWGTHGIGIDFTPQKVLSPAPLVIGADIHALLPLIPDETFGLIIFCHSLEHLPNYTFALEQAWRLLAQDGLLAIAVPHPDSADWIPPDGGHLTLFTPDFLFQRMQEITKESPEDYVERIALRPDHDETWGVWKKP
jgi:SAM-dependent methyltransferase